MKRYKILILILFPLLFHCGDLDRDNALDPKNPAGYANQVVLVELFVNDSTGYNYCNLALNVIEEISEREDYKDKLCVLEYHLFDSTWNDPNSLISCNKRYDEYVPPNSPFRGIPYAFFNGMVDTVLGATNQDIVEYRYLSALQELTGEKAYFRIEADKSISDDFISLEIKVARLGRHSKNDLNLNVVLYEDLGNDFHRFVVRKILQSQSINSMKPGQVKSFSFSEQLQRVQNQNSVYALVFIQDQKEATQEVYQVAKF